jgi:hypothetical protein
MRNHFHAKSGEVSPDQLLGNIDKLMNAALATSTKITYKRAWDQFNVFSLETPLPATEKENQPIHFVFLLHVYVLP